ncbi:MAG: M48 family metalloprotease [Hyphomicrobiales bacterium]
MFGNFIYFILVLLIYSTYQPSEEVGLAASESLLLFALLAMAFAGFTRLAFKRIESRIDRMPFGALDQMFHTAQLRSSILAVLVFAVDIYGLSLPFFADGLPLMARIPTLKALLFIALFVGYLCVVWGAGYGAYRRLYLPDFSRRDYIASNISFSVPVLLPWLLLSGVLDLIYSLPMDGLKRILATTEGQIAYFSIFLLGVAVMGPAMIKRFWRCTPLAQSPVRLRIEALCSRAGMSYADILHWPLFGGKMITAGVMGLVRRFRYILVTPSLLELLAPDELDAVIAHEIGHIKKKHLLFYLLFFAGYLLLSYVMYDVVIYAMIFAEPVWTLIHHSGLNQAMVASVVFSVMILAVFLVYFRFVFGFFMRNFERQADGYVFALFDSARPLVSTLRKIAFTSRQSSDRPNWHHYSITERIDFLSRCEENRGWLRHHDSRVRRGIGVYIAALVLLGAAGYQMNMGTVGARLSDHLFQTVILREIQKNPQNPSLYGLLGDLQYRRKNYAEVQQAYETSLSLKADNPVVLNNLAWLLATCEDKRFRSPARALELARRAAELQESAYILDTLAECYFATGNLAEAIQAEKRALALAKGDRSQYETQLRRFMQAASRGQPASTTN